MSYARFGHGESSVYVYLSEGSLVCCACSLTGWSESFYTTADLLAHLRAHEAAGGVVPAHTFAGLEHDADENDAWIAEAHTL